MIEDCNISFFIIGVGRSGTTLLQSMLNAHPQISVPPESHFFRKYVVPEFRKQIPKKSFDDIADTLKKDFHLARLKVDLNALLKNFTVKNDAFFFRDLFSKTLKVYSEKMGKKIVGEKDPSYTHLLREIFSIYPNTRIIHLIRDPRDVILSRSKTVWGKDRSFLSHLISYNDAFSSARDRGPKLFGKKYIEILYENLIINPQRELQKICQILGLNFHEDMLQFYSKSSQIVSEEERQWKQNVFEPIMRQNTQKWLQGLPKWKVILIEAVCGTQIESLGYQLSNYCSSYIKYLCGSPIYFYLFVQKLKRLLANNLFANRKI